MRNYYISINQMAEFSASTVASKKRIIKQQQNPNKLLLPWYQLPKARIKKCIEMKGDLTPIEEAFKILEVKKTNNNRQKTDKQVSIEALERFVKMRLPKILKDIGDFEILKLDKKTLSIGDVEIIVAPEVVIKGKLNGKVVYGAVKIHISKNKPFDSKQGRYVATTIQHFLQASVAKKGENVIPELCFCLDVFSGRMVKASNDKNTFIEIKNICSEIKTVWDTP